MKNKINSFNYQDVCIYLVLSGDQLGPPPSSIWNIYSEYFYLSSIKTCSPGPGFNFYSLKYHLPHIKYTNTPLHDVYCTINHMYLEYRSDNKYTSLSINRITVRNIWRLNISIVYWIKPVFN